MKAQVRPARCCAARASLRSHVMLPLQFRASRFIPPGFKLSGFRPPSTARNLKHVVIGHPGTAYHTHCTTNMWQRHLTKVDPSCFIDTQQSLSLPCTLILARFCPGLPQSAFACAFQQPAVTNRRRRCGQSLMRPHLNASVGYKPPGSLQ